MLPKILQCPHCREELELEESERTVQTLNCPACGKEIRTPNEPGTRYPIVALCLSLLAPGLGQFYNNQIKKALIVFAVYLGATVLTFTPLPTNFLGFSFIALLWIGSVLYGLLESTLTAHRIKRIRLARYQRWYSYLSIIVVSQAISLLLFDATPIKSWEITTVSMEPTLSVGDLCIVDKGFYLHHSIGQRKLAVFSYPDEPSVSYINRCLATAGQTVVIRNRIPTVDGKGIWVPGYDLGRGYPILPPDRIEPNIFPANAGNGDNYGPIVVPEEKCFMLGDNIANCLDSRYKGFVDLKEITGKPLFVYWSSDLSRIGILLK